MNMIYFKARIMEELADARDYLKSAIELKGSKPEWSKCFYEMGTAEIEHAAHFYKMEEEHYKSIVGAYKTIPEYLVEDHVAVNHAYEEMTKEILALKEMYSK